MLESGHKNAFTLIELLVVITIIIILMAILLPNLMTARGRALEAAALSELTQIDTALERYYLDQGLYPEEEADYSSSAFISALQGQKQYYPFNAKRLKNGAYYSPLDQPYFYRENWTELTKTADMHNSNRFDLWTMDRKGEEAVLNNWGGLAGAADQGLDTVGGGELPPPPPPPP